MAGSDRAGELFCAMAVVREQANKRAARVFGDGFIVRLGDDMILWRAGEWILFAMVWALLT